MPTKAKPKFLKEPNNSRSYIAAKKPAQAVTVLKNRVLYFVNQNFVKHIGADFSCDVKDFLQVMACRAAFNQVSDRIFLPKRTAVKPSRKKTKERIR
jgi:hypothetical protein